MTDRNPLRFQPPHQRQHPLQRVHERRHPGQLRTDMAIHANDFQMRRGGGPRVDRQRPLHLDAKLVLLESGGDIRVRIGVHVRIDAQRHRRPLASFRRHALQQRQLCFGFDVETADLHFEGVFQFVTALADPRKHNFSGIAASRQHSFQLTARHDIETGPQPSQYVQHRQVAVGLDRIADQVRMLAESLVESAPVAFDRGAGINVARGANRRRDVGDRHVLGMQPAVAVFEMVHDSRLHGGGLLGRWRLRLGFGQIQRTLLAAAGQQRHQ